MSNINEMKQAIERVKPFLWNEDSQVNDTLELHADFEVDDDGTGTFHGYFLNASDDSDGVVWLSELIENDCPCPFCGILWTLNNHADAVEQGRSEWNWLMIHSCVKDFLEVVVSDRGGQIGPDDSVFDVLMQAIELSARKIQYVEIGEFTGDDIKAFDMLVDRQGPDDCWEWFGDSHPSGQPIHWFGKKALLVKDIVVALNSDDPQPMVVVGTKE